LAPVGVEKRADGGAKVPAQLAAAEFNHGPQMESGYQET
jgi:hypothetical protein